MRAEGVSEQPLMSDGILASAAADPALFLAKVMIAVGLIGLLCQVVSFRCRKLIADWADRGGWSVVECRRVLLARQSPFAFVPGMPVYEVTLASASGRTRQAHIRCGNMTMSVLSDELAVEWAG
jgi:hypothetical protein